MGKYLHYYDDLGDFKRDYTDEGGANSFVCSAGTFTYDRYENEMGGAYFWKNGDKELDTPWRNPKVGSWDYAAGTGAWDDEEKVGVEITAIGEVVPGKYQAPWVSYTTYEKQLKIEAGTIYDKVNSNVAVRGTNVTLTPIGEVNVLLIDCR